MAAERRSDMLSRSRIVTTECGPDSPAESCTCREAVTRAYRGMTTSGAAPSVALDAATRVFAYHHPTASYEHARETVEHWVVQSIVH